MRQLIIYGLMCLLSFSSNSFGQSISFQALDEPVVKQPMRTCVTPDGKLVIVNAESQIGFQSGRLYVKQWNGQFWVEYPSVFASPFQVGNDNRLSVCSHDGRIYAAGSFNNFDSSYAGIISWNGNIWEKTAGGISSNYSIHKDVSMNDVVSFQNLLFVCGRFNLAGGLPVHNFIVLENGKWNPVGTGEGSVNDLQVLNDTLYCAGKFSQVQGAVNTNIAAYTNNKWMSIPSPTPDEIIGMGIYGTKLFAFSNQMPYVMQGNGSTWTKADKQWDFKINVFGNAAFYQGKIYIAGTFTNSAGLKSHLLAWDGQNWEVIVREGDARPFGQLNYYIDARNDELLFSGRISSFFGKAVQHVVRLLPGKTIVSGRVYKDVNQDCAFDAMDVPLSGVLLSLDNGSYYTSTDKEGFYSLALDNSKTSSLRVYPVDDLESLCQGAEINITTGDNDASLTKDFALQQRGMAPIEQTLELFSSRGFKARHGYTSDYTVSYKSGNARFPMRIDLDYDKRLHYESGDLEPVVMDEGKLSWIIYADTDIHVVFKLPPSINTGEFLQFHAGSFFSDTNALQPQRMALEQEVVSAFDPNEKQCSDAKITRKDRFLDYNVQFQNLGNDSAVHVFVVDTISRSLPMQFIQVLNYSHPDHYNIGFRVRDHAIIWHFDQILLPPKNQAGDAASSGYIRFRAGLDAQLRVGDSITNQAHIYFDYQDPVHTNTVVSKVVDNKPLPRPTEQLQLYLYPNPVSSLFTLDMYPYLMKEIKIYDVNGREIYSRELDSPASIVSVNPGELAAGVYVVNVMHTFGVISKQFVVTN